MISTSTSLYSDFEREITKSEFQRTRIMLGAFLMGLLLMVINFFALTEEVITFYGGRSHYFFSLGWLLIFAVYEFFILRLIVRMMRKGKMVSDRFKVMHSLIEVSFPSLLMFYMVHSKEMLMFVDSPVVFLYWLFIILSVLHLDFKINLMVGLFSAIQYGLVVYYGFHFTETKAEYLIQLPENSFYLRCIILIICGAAAGFVSEEVKRRVRSSFDSKIEKRNMEELLGQQVSREVAEALVSGSVQTIKQQATVLALDLRNFSHFAEYRSPDEILDFQNKIFSPILEIINQHQGIVNQIMGDGIMATFGTPVSNPLHADMAFQASIQIIHKVRELSEMKVIPTTRVGIGLHTGEVITGNIGNQVRRQYSTSGSAVIIAFRVEQLNKELDGELLITEEVKNRIELGRVKIEPLGPRPLKGFGSSINIYRVNV